MEQHYQRKLRIFMAQIWKTNADSYDCDIATSQVLRAYLPANLVAEAESRIEAQRAPRMTAEEHNKFPGGRW